MPKKDLTASWSALLEYDEAKNSQSTGDYFCVRIRIVDAEGECAACVEHFHDLSIGEDALGCFDCVDLGIQCAIALDAFSECLIGRGYTREEAVSLRNAVSIPETIAERGHPTWGYMTDEERHRAICARLNIADPWSTA
jgi:hypothetical protein